MRLLFLILATLLAALPLWGEDASAPIPETGLISTGLRVFTCGNSFHAWFVPQVMADMAAKAGIGGHIVVGVSRIGGSKAIQHWNVPDEKNEAKAALRAGKVDVLTLACMLQPDEGIEKFVRLALEGNPRVRVTIQEFWIPSDTDAWPYPGDINQVDFDAPTPESLRALHQRYFKAMDDYVDDLNARLGAGHPVLFAVPAGQAVLALRERIVAGKVPGIVRQSDLFADKIGHPRPPLEALVSYCNFAVVYRRSPVGLPMPEVLARARKDHPDWDEALNRTLQEIAWQAVTDNPRSGVTAAP